MFIMLWLTPGRQTMAEATPHFHCKVAVWGDLLTDV